MQEAEIIWHSAIYTCSLVNHPVAGSYEVRVLESGRVIQRRWFDTLTEADKFIQDARNQYAAGEAWHA